MRMSLALWGTAIAIAAAGILGVEKEAQACGGCFIANETPTVVTDHRMVFTISKTRSTLYDQIKYSGDPTQFAWVLPISGTVTVGLSADIVFSTLDGRTQTQIVPPPRNCPGPPPSCFSSSSGAFGGGTSGGSSGSPGVNVLVQQVVGPYETVQLAATTPNALQTWLADNGFNIPTDVAPILTKYQEEHFNFLALKLLPDKGVTDMRPVRVSTEGASVALPLRMVAAGTGAKVGISLWVIGEGRYEPQNFGSFSLVANDLAWDWQQNKSNYTDLRNKREQDSGFSIWEVESATTLDRLAFESSITQGSGYLGASSGTTPEAIAGRDYLPEKDSLGNVVKTATQVRDDDIATLLYGISGTPRVTRMRADLARAALATDLLMKASSDQSDISPTRVVTKELNQPLCPVYNGCQATGQQLPRDQIPPNGGSDAGAGNGVGAIGGGETFTCSASVRGDDALSMVGLGVLGIAAVLVARKRRR
jgi:hypothetical protein